MKLTLEMMFGYVLKWNQNDFDHIWVEQICAAVMLDFFQRGLTFNFWSKFQISSKFVYSQIGPWNHVCWSFRAKLNWFWRYIKMSNLISRHFGFFPKGLAYDFGSKFQISSNSSSSQIGPRNHVRWCFRVRWK